MEHYLILCSVKGHKRILLNHTFHLHKCPVLKKEKVEELKNQCWGTNTSSLFVSYLSFTLKIGSNSKESFRPEIKLNIGIGLGGF